MGLFQTEEFKLNSGIISDFKIDCDHLSDEDLDTLALKIAASIKFHKVFGVPSGGIRLEQALKKYEYKDKPDYPTLIVDDVLTSGGSMERFVETLKNSYKIENYTGIVIFARKKCPDWIRPIFQMYLR
jgi:orotate phosphoribosyltransferase